MNSIKINAFDSLYELIDKEEFAYLLNKFLNENFFDEEKAVKLGYKIYDKTHITYFSHKLESIQKEIIKEMLEKRILDADIYNKIMLFFEKLQNAIAFGYSKHCIEKSEIVEDKLYSEKMIPKIFIPSAVFKNNITKDFSNASAKPSIKMDPKACEVYKEIEDVNIPDDVKENIHAAHKRLHDVASYFYKLLEEKDIKNAYGAFWRMRYFNLLIVAAISLYELKKEEYIAKSLKIQERLTKFNRLLAKINSLINQAQDEKELFQKICDTTIKIINAKLAWIGKPDESGKFQVLASSGETDYLDDIFISINPNIPQGQGPTGKAWQNEKFYFTNSFIESEQTKPWHERAKKFGISKSISLPIFKNKELYATFNLYLSDDEEFDDELIKILEEISKDIGYGLDRIELKEFTDALLNNMTSGILVVRFPERIIEYTNKKFLEMFGIPSEDYIIGHSVRELYFDDKTYEMIGKLGNEVLTKGYAIARNVSYKRFDNIPIHIDISGQILHKEKNANKIVWTFVDVEERYQLEQSLKAELEFNKLLLENPAAGIIIVEYPQHIVKYVNNKMLEILKAPSEKDLIGKPVKDLYADENIFNIVGKEKVKEALEKGYTKIENVPYKRFDGSIVHLDKIGQRLSVKDNGEFEILWIFLDVEYKHKLEKEINTDTLTGLYNLRTFKTELKKAFDRAKESKKLLVLCKLDLDDFKLINNTYGQNTGDEILKIITNRLKSMFKDNYLARVGGDEFMLLLEDINNKNDLHNILEKIDHTIKTPIGLPNGDIISITTSIGVAVYDPNNDDIDNEEELMRMVDKALYEIKAHKQDRLANYAIYGEEIKTKPTKFQELLYEGLVEIFYQPILDLKKSKIVGLEALARLKDKNGDIISPAVFLPELNTEDLFLLHTTIIDKSLKDLEELDKLGYKIWVSINLDPSNVNSHFIAKIKEHISKSNINPNRIILEILEGSSFEERESALNYIHELKSLGVQIALDDFGAAYSSLLRTKELPIDEIKLDQAFVKNLERNPKDLFFVHAVSLLAENLHVKLVVEGVETRDILDALIMLDIDMVQGYFIAKSMPFESLKEFLNSNYEFLLPKNPPESLLGVYAQSIIHHNSFKTLINEDINALNYKELQDYKACKVYQNLKKLLPYEDSILENLHKEYHIALGEAIKNNITRQEPINWDILDEIFISFQNYIEELYKKLKSSNSQNTPA